MRKTFIHSYARSHVGKKALMAASGLVLVAFVVVHTLANLQMFAGPARIDGYAQGLRRAPALLWSARALLTGAFVVHVFVGAQLAAMNRAARPVPYRRRWGPRAAVAARSMAWTGGVLGLFVVVHLANLTWGVLHPRFVPGHVYANVVALLRHGPVAAAYAVAMLALALHVAHGAWSVWQSLGFDGVASWPGARRLGRVVAVAVAGGLLSVVGAAALGWLR